MLSKQSLSFSNIIQCNFYHVSQQSLIRKNIRYKIFFTLMFVKSIMYFLMSLVSINIVSKSPLPSTSWCPLIAQKENFHVQFIAIGVFNMPFDTFTKLFIVILSFLIKILVLLLFVIFHHPRCCFNVFLLLTKPKSPLNQNTPST